jgi:hypothetical protein
VEFLLVLAVVLVVVAVVMSPLRGEWTGRPDKRSAPADLDDRHELGELADLEAARDAKYREIRDAELDRRTGKLSEEDFEAIDGTLRSEAIEILRAIDQANDRQAATIVER